jgi:hypothetical protein
LIEDLSVEDSTIVEYIGFLVAKNEDARVCFQSYRDSDFIDNFSLLHYAAKYCRALVCEYLIDEISISKTKLFFKC